jgi:4-amino-4-deoxy-L-arabinose transferase-like glycosyltransferase
MLLNKTLSNIFTFSKIKSKVQQHSTLLNDKYYSSKDIIVYSLFVLLVFNFVLAAIGGINNASDPQGYDTTAYLGEANSIRYHGGVFTFINQAVTGVWDQANQHPLYILFLTPFASFDISFFITAKIISAVIGLILIILLFSIGKKMYGNLVASVAVFALIINAVFIEWSTLVACESLLMLTSTLCIYFVMEGFKDNKYWIYAGIFAGLAYLTKGSGLFLLPGFALAVLIIYRMKAFKNKFFWLFFILFLFTSSPLIIRNIVVYQNPFFNVNNYLATMGWDKIYYTRYLTFSLETGTSNWIFVESDFPAGEDSKVSAFNFSDHMQKVKKEIGVFLETINISWAGKLPNALKNIFALFLFLLFVVGIFREKNRGGRIYFLITFVIFFLALSINPIDRYFLPVIPMMWIYIAFGFLSAVDYVNKNFIKKYSFNPFPYLAYILLLILIANAVNWLLKKDLSNPMLSVEYSESRRDLLNWLRNNLEKGDKYVMGPNFNWQLEKGIWIIPPVYTKSNFLEYQSFIKEHKISYAIIDKNIKSVNAAEWQSAAGRKKKSNFIDNYFEVDPVKGVVEKKEVENWKLVYKDPVEPVDYMIYKID